MRRLVPLALAVVGASLLLLAAESSSLAAGTTSSGLTTVKTLRGVGARVVTTQLPSGPLVFTVVHRGESNLVVQLRGPAGSDLLVNEIGTYAGQAVAQTRSGKHRVVVTADGAWTIQVFRPTTASVRALPGSFSGNGSKVFSVRSAKARELVLTAANKGDSNFVVYLYGYAGLNGRDLLVNEIGPWKGQVLTDVPKGYLLLSVEASGSWTARFVP